MNMNEAFIFSGAFLHGASSVHALCAIGEVGDDAGVSIPALDREGVAVTPVWSSRQDMPVLSPKHLSAEFSNRRLRVPF